MPKTKKERDIVKLLYEENKEYSKVMAFVKKHMRDNHLCKGFASKKIKLEYDLPITSMGNAICDYIDYLQKKLGDVPKQTASCENLDAIIANEINNLEIRILTNGK